MRAMSVIALSRVVAALVQFGTLALIARSFGVADFGRFAIVMSLVLVSMSFLELGLGNRALRVIADDRQAASITTILLVRIVTNTVVLVLVLAIATTLALLETPLTALVILYITGDLFGNLGQSILIGLRRERSAALLLLTRRLATLLVLLVGATYATGEMYAYFALALTGLLGYVMTPALLRRSISRPTNPARFIWTNRHYLSASLAGNLQQSDTLLLGLLASPQLAGLYGAATRLASPVNLLPSAILQSVVPPLAAETDPLEKLKKFHKVRTAMLMMSVAILATTPLVPWAFVALFGESFADASPMAVAVVVACAFNTVVQAYQAWFYATGMRPFISALLLTNTVIAVSSACLAGLMNSLLVAAIGVSAGAALIALAFAIYFHLCVQKPIYRNEV